MSLHLVNPLALALPPLDDEPARLAALRRLEVLDTEPEQPFEDVVSLVCAVLGVPMASVTLVDAERQWFKARRGMNEAESARDISFCTHAIQQHEPLVVPDATNDLRFAGNPFVLGAPGIRSYAGIPLQTTEGYNVGTLCAIDTAPRIFSAADLAVLVNLARIVVTELELRRIAHRDQLTGALSRRAFLEQAQHELERRKRYGRPACLAMVDVDHFKAVNDTYGHAAGDLVLTRIAAVLGALMRPTDAFGRLGGEEFAILMSETDAAEGMIACERFRAAIEGHVFDLPGGETLRVTVSMGLAALHADMTTAERWIACADIPLYAAKHGGRNRCVSV